MSGLTKGESTLVFCLSPTSTASGANFLPKELMMLLLSDLIVAVT